MEATFTFSKAKMKEVKKNYQENPNSKFYFQAPHHGACLQIITPEGETKNVFAGRMSNYKGFLKEAGIRFVAVPLNELYNEKLIQFVLNGASRKFTLKSDDGFKHFTLEID